MRRYLIKWMLLLVVVLLAGCKNPLTDHGEDYVSRIYAIYADMPKTALIFFGEKYQYVFPGVDQNLAALLERKGDLGYTIGDEYETESLHMQLSILADGDPYLILFIQFGGETLTDAQRGWLLKHGFEAGGKTGSDGAAMYTYNQQLKGKRYRADNDTSGMLDPLSAGPLRIQGRDFSDDKNPQVAESPVRIGAGDVWYEGRRFVALPF